MFVFVCGTGALPGKILDCPPSHNLWREYFAPVDLGVLKEFDHRFCCKSVVKRNCLRYLTTIIPRKSIAGSLRMVLKIEGSCYFSRIIGHPLFTGIFINTNSSGYYLPKLGVP